MTSLQKKSDIMFESAILLDNKNLYPCVAHAAYYSCYQLLKYIWLNPMSKTEDDFNKELNDYNQLDSNRGRLGSHDFLLKQVVEWIGSNNNSYKRDIRNKMPQLKKLRIKGDYKDCDFCYNDSKASLELARNLRTILKNF